MDMMIEWHECIGCVSDCKECAIMESNKDTKETVINTMISNLKLNSTMLQNCVERIVKADNGEDKLQNLKMAQWYINTYIIDIEL